MLVIGLLRIKYFNFQGFPMSQTPQTLPKRTRVLVKDIFFQEKYSLTHTQIDIMAYIINALTWATKVGSFFPLSNKKFHQDLPQIGEKTLEEALRVLKAMELIEVEMIIVPKWNNARVRGISVLPKGLEYNSNYYRADEKEIINNLKEQLHQLQEKLKNLEAVENETQILEEAKESEESTDYDDLSFTELVKTVTKEFGETSEPICNGVKGWVKETKFYINSYNKLTLLSPLGEVVQLKNPVEISNFWKYLSENRHKIGDVIDFEKELTVEELNNRYSGINIELNGIKFRVHKIEEHKDGVKVSIQNIKSKNIAVISKDEEATVFEIEECQKVLLELRS